MPNGLPNSSALNNRKACAFALDTSVIEAAGFRFNDGPLRHLAGQLPPWFQLWMPDIVLREIRQHRTDNVSRSVQQIQTGMQDLRRHIGGAFRQTEPDWLKTAKDSATNVFDAQFQNFLNSHNGIVLKPTHERLSSKIFEMYFQGHPPFGGGKDKKHEFPDAASLLMLDYLAAEKHVQVVAVSKDVGWKAYAEQSAHIYCVSSLQELAAMFLSKTSEAKGIQRRLCDVFETPTAGFKRSIKEALEKGLISLPWRIKLPRSYRYGFDAEVIETTLKSFKAHPEAMGVWITSPQQDACVAEIPVDVDVSLRVEVVAYRYDDYGQRIDVTIAQAMIEHEFEAKLQLELTGTLQTTALEDLIKNMELGDTPIEVVVGRDKLGPDWMGEPAKESPRSGFDDMDDDIPF